MLPCPYLNFLKISISFLNYKISNTYDTCILYTQQYSTQLIQDIIKIYCSHIVFKNQQKLSQSNAIINAIGI